MAGIVSAVATYSINAFVRALKELSDPKDLVPCTCARKCVRRLGKAELGMKFYEESSDGKIGCIVKLASQYFFNNHDWIAALENALQCYPMLSMTVGPCASNSSQRDELFFKQIPHGEALKQIVNFSRDSKSFPDLSELLHYEREDTTNRDETSSPHSSNHATHMLTTGETSAQREVLWRTYVLREYDSNRSMNYYTLGFVFSHCIVDGTSLVIMLQHLISYLNGNIHFATIKPVVPPAMENLVPFSFVVWPIGEITELLTKIMTKFKIKPWIYFSSMKKFFKVYPAPVGGGHLSNDQNPTHNVPCSSTTNICKEDLSTARNNAPNYITPIDKRETLVSVMKLSQTQTAYFLRRCKQQNCSVTAALLTAANIAMASLMQAGILQKNVTVLADVTMDLRRYMSPKTDDEAILKQVFCAAPLSTLTVKARLGKIGNLDTFRYFWKHTHNLSTELKSRIRSGEILSSWYSRRKLFADHLSFSTLLKMAEDDSEGFGRFHHILLSNLGNIEIQNQCSGSPVINSPNKGLMLDDIQFGASGSVLGNVLMNYIGTVNGQLVWNLCYFDHITRDEEAESFLNLVRDIIVQFAIPGPNGN